MLRSTQHLEIANEILRFAQDDNSGGSLLRLMHIAASVEIDIRIIGLYCIMLIKVFVLTRKEISL
jgi:hypothetical protein